jgi:hypothetical protein
MVKDEKDGVDRRGALECMIWAGAGVMAANEPRSSLLGISEANAQPASGFTFLQISDSDIGFKQKLIKDVVDGVSNVAQIATAVSLGSQSSANLDKAKQIEEETHWLGRCRKLLLLVVPQARLTRRAA